MITCFQALLTCSFLPRLASRGNDLLEAKEMCWISLNVTAALISHANGRKEIPTQCGHKPWAGESDWVSSDCG